MYPQKDTRYIHSPILNRNLIYTHQKQKYKPCFIWNHKALIHVKPRSLLLLNAEAEGILAKASDCEVGFRVGGTLNPKP